ncbi:MAG: hypothetical protein ABR936_05360 [Bacteroidota bacterium]|jgi:hypothetical protein
MDDDFTRAVVIAGIFIGFIVLFVWMTSRTKRRIVNAVARAQEALKLTPIVSTHPQLDVVWCATRGQVSGLTIRIFGGRSRSGRNAGVAEGTRAIDKAFVMIIVSLPNIIPFRFNIQRRLALSAPHFGTSYAEFDKFIEVITDNEKKALTLLSNEQLRTAIVSFIKSTANAFITSSEVIIKVSSDKQVLPAAKEAVNLALMLKNQIGTIQ